MDDNNGGPLEAFRVEIAMIVHENVTPYVRFGSSSEVYEYFKHMRNFDREYLLAVCIDPKLRVSAHHTVSIGTLTASIVHPREVFKAAILANASGLIMLHNHPSGDPNPSAEDKRITRRIEEAGRLMGIPLIDHVIIGIETFYSFADAGAIEASYSEQRGMVLR